MGMKESKSKPNVSIRIDPEVLHKAKVEAVKAKIAIGEWLEEAITEKITGKKTKTMRKERRLIRREAKVSKDSKLTT